MNASLAEPNMKRNNQPKTARTKIARIVSFSLFALILALLAPRGFRAFPANASAAEAAAPQPVDPVTTSTLNDQSDVDVTVYNSDLALVRDVRQINIPAGESQLRFMDIAASVNP